MTDLYILSREILIDSLSIKSKSLSTASFYPLELLLKTFCDGISGTLRDQYFVSSVDPGFGKTEAVIAFIKAYKLLKFKPEGGILICLSTLAEIETFTSRSELNEIDYAIYVGFAEPLNDKGLGRGGRSIAPILLTTQKMITLRLAENAMSGASAFHFYGKPRALTIWDESAMPALPAVIGVDAISGAIGTLRKADPNLVKHLEGLRNEVELRDNGDIVSVPNGFPDRLGTDEERVAFEKLAGAQKDTIRTILGMRGKSMLIREDSIGGRKLIGSLNPLPADFAPVVILDASARVRPTYSAWDKHRGTLVRLPALVADYQDTNFRYWKHSCGRTAMNKKVTREYIAEQLAAVIDGSPDEEWLVVGFKAGEFEIEKDINRCLRSHAKVGFTHWGKHLSINDYRGAKNVIIIGNYFKPIYSYEASFLAASGLPLRGIDGLDIRDFREAECSHDWLQAVCRGYARVHDDDRAGACNVYVVSSSYIDTEKVLKSTFPGCQVSQWFPVEPALKGHSASVIDALREMLFVKGLSEVSKNVIAGLAGIKRTATLSEVIGRQEFLYHMEQLGVSTTNRKFVRV